jgi:hypothetical protein
VRPCGQSQILELGELAEAQACGDVTASVLTDGQVGSRQWGPWNQGMIDPTRYHGLDIVRAVADEWGIDGDNTTRSIWARFDCPKQL